MVGKGTLLARNTWPCRRISSLEQYMLSGTQGPAAGTDPWNSICYQEHVTLPQDQIPGTVYTIRITWPCRRISSLEQYMLSGTHGPAAKTDPWNRICYQEHMALPQDQIPGTEYAIRNTWPCCRIRSLEQYRQTGTHGPPAGSDPWNSIFYQEHVALPQDQIPGTVSAFTKLCRISSICATQKIYHWNSIL